MADYDLVVELSRDVGLGDWIFAEPASAGALEGFLDECVAARLVHRDGAQHLALSLPTPANPAST